MIDPTRRAYGVRPRVGTGAVHTRHATRARASRRRGPVMLVGHIRRVLEASFHGEGYRVGEAAGRGDPHLEGAGALNAGHDLQAPHRVGHAHGPIGGPRCDVGDGPDDHGDGRRGGGLRPWRCPRVIGLHAAKSGSRSRPWRSVRASNASAPLAKAWPWARLSTYLPTIFNSRVLRHRKLPELRAGARSGVAERFIRLKENVLQLRHDRGAPPRFARVQADVQRALDLERYDYRSPAQVDATERPRRCEYRQTTGEAVGEA